MVKPLIFKGEKRSIGATHKKRKREEERERERQKERDLRTFRLGNRSTARTTELDNVDGDDDDGGDNDEIDDFPVWVVPPNITDLNGPVVLVFRQFTPAVLLSADEMGSVFGIPLSEESTDKQCNATCQSNNTGLTFYPYTRPHDTRQVWIISRVAGSQAFTLKTPHDTYLSADKLGLVSSDSLAVGIRETWQLTKLVNSSTNTSSSGFTLRSSYGRYICIHRDTTPKSQSSRAGFHVSADVEDPQDAIFDLRMQVNNLPNETLQHLHSAHDTSVPLGSSTLKKRSGTFISRIDLEKMVGCKLSEHQVHELKEAHKNGTLHEHILDMKVKLKSDRMV